VLAPNKTLPPQLYSKCASPSRERGRVLFSYYDYTNPEAYVPSATSIREGLEHQRAHRADAPVGDEVAARTQRPVIVATVSCIYGIGNPSIPRHDPARARKGADVQRDIIGRLAAMQYERNELEFKRGNLPRSPAMSSTFPRENSETALRIRAHGR